MAKPYVHACSSARKWGGEPEDYLPIHNLMDSSKGVIADSRHRALTHTSWFLWILEQVFGSTINNSAGRVVSVRDVGEQHILEDFGGRFIPSAQDYLENMEVKEWMVAGKGAPPSSSAKLPSERPTTTRRVLDFAPEHRCGVEGFDGTKDTCPGCENERKVREVAERLDKLLSRSAETHDGELDVYVDGSPSYRRPSHLID